MAQQNLNGSILTTIENKIATLEFGHPASNSFPSDLLERLTNELNKLSQNIDASVIILKSSGSGAFCAGASFDELLAVSNLEEATKFFSGFANVLNAMRNCSKINHWQNSRKSRWWWSWHYCCLRLCFGNHRKLHKIV
jgi:methylglutaconyl-CoA hydratase